MVELTIEPTKATGTRPGFETGRAARRLVRAAALAATLALLLLPRPAHGWADNGHRIVAQIAEDGLSAPARERIRALVGERRLAQLAAWPDFIRAEPGWKFAETWHYVTVEDGGSLADVLAAAAATPKPDNVVEAIGFFAAILRGDAAKAKLLRELMAKGADQVAAEPFEGSVEKTALAFLVHFVGDVHQPLHAGRGGDRGGNQIKVNWFDEPSNLHTVWDQGLIASEHLSFTEYADFLEREFAGRKAEWRGGSPADWAAESIALRGQVYDIWRKTSRTNFLPDLGYDYAHDQIGVVDRRLVQGGVRLGELLDSIFGAKP